ncbi:MAG: ComEC/Rec2 family competence protein [Acidobacteriota bacterium]
MLLATGFVVGCRTAGADWPSLPPEHLVASALVLTTACLLALRVRAPLGLLLALSGWLAGALHGRPTMEPLDIATLERRGVLEALARHPVHVRGELRGVLVTRAGPTSRHVEAELHVHELDTGRLRLPVRGRLTLRVPRERRTAAEAHRTVSAWVRLQPTRSLTNPGVEHRRPSTRPPSALVISPLLMKLDGRPRLVDRWRRGIDRHLRENVDDDTATAADWVRALVLGTRAALDPSDQRSLKRAGLAHVLAVSGLHVSLAALGVGGTVAWLCGGRRRPGLVAGVLAAWTLAMLAGSGVPVLRAAMITSLLGCAVLLRRPGSSRAALAVAALACSLLAPESTRTLGFELSFGATLGLCVLSGPLRRLLPRGRLVGWAGLRNALSWNLAATLATWPWLLGLGGMNAAAPVLNLLALPLVVGLTLLSLLLAVAGPVVPGLTTFGLAIVDALATALVTLGEAGGGGFHETAAPGSLVSWLHGTGLLVLAATADMRTRLLGWLALLTAPMILVASGTATPRWDARVVVLDVGQGSSALVEIARPSGRPWSLLVDGGGWPGSRLDVGERVVIPSLRALGVSELDVVVLSHADFDHRGGLPSVVRRCRPRALWLGPGPDADRKSLEPLVASARSVGTRVGLLAAGARLGPANPGTLGLEVAWPSRHPADRWGLSENDASVVLRLVDHEGRGLALLPGDIEREAELRLVNRARLRSPLLVLPHHGSRTSSSAELLAAVRPRLAVASAGRTRFGHPHAEVLERLARGNRATWVTAEHGAIVFELTRSGRGWLVDARALAGERRLLGLHADLKR